MLETWLIRLSNLFGLPLWRFLTIVGLPVVRQNPGSSMKGEREKKGWAPLSPSQAHHQRLKDAPSRPNLIKLSLPPNATTEPLTRGTWGDISYPKYSIVVQHTLYKTPWASRTPVPPVSVDHTVLLETSGCRVMLCFLWLAHLAYHDSLGFP